jgi:hypothetical protein
MRAQYTLRAAVVAATTTLALAVATPALATASAKVTLKSAHSSVLTGTANVFSGRVTPHAGQRKVQLQTLAHQKWHTLTSHLWKPDGSYSIRWVITSPGAKTYRVRAEPNSHGKNGATSAKVRVTGLRWHYLADLDSVDSSCGCSFGSIEINGKNYAHSVYDAGTTGGDVFIEYNLRRGCRSLSTEVGLGDDSDSSSSALMEISVDGNTLFSQDFGLGQSQRFTHSVEGNLRLRLDWTNHDSDNDLTVGYGTAKVLCNW